MTLKRSFTLLISGVLSAIALSGPLRAEGANIWQAKTSGSFVTLRYGSLDEQEKPVFLLSCLNGVEIAVLSVYLDFPQEEPGEAITVAFSANGQTAQVAGETAREDGTGTIYGDAGDIAVKPILKILSEKGPVSMRSGANGVELSTAGRAEAVEQFSENCSLD